MKQKQVCPSQGAQESPACASRRAFLRGLPVITAGAAATPLPALAGQPGARWGMLVDVRKCIGCQACTIACGNENDLPEDGYRTIVSTYSIKQPATAGQPAGTYLLARLCNHCDNPPCIPVCPVGATFKRADGLVLVDGDRCVGCAYCVQACPYDARFINHQTGKADKCTFCGHRLEAGLLPACVETCVGGARIFGDLNDPQGELSRRMAAAGDQLKVLKPEQGTQPRVFYIGLDERLQGKVQGQGAPWKPQLHGGRA